MRLTFLVFFVLLSILGLSQNQKIDSLKSLLRNDKSGTYMQLYPEIAWEYIVLGDFAHAFEYSGKAYSFALNTRDSLLLVRAGKIKSSALRRSGQIDSAMKVYEFLLPISRRNGYDSETDPMLNSLGILYGQNADYDKSLKCLFESLALRQKHGDKFHISVVLQNIGLIYYKLDDIDKALSFYHRSLQLKNLLVDVIGINELHISDLLVNIALCHVEKKNYNAAMSFIERAYTTCGQDCSDYFRLGASYALGVIFFKKGDFQNAERKFLDSYTISKQLHDKRLELDNIIYLSDIYLRCGKHTLAESFLKKGEALISKDSPYKLELIGVYDKYISLFKKTSDMKNLAFYQDKYISLRDSIYSRSRINTLMKLEAEFLQRENIDRIVSQNEILSLKEDVINRQTIANVSISSVAVLIVMLAIVLAKANRQKRNVNRILEGKVRERTQELEKNESARRHAWQERDILIKQASTDLKSSIATLRGLSYLGAKESDHTRVQQYWKELEVISNRLSTIPDRLGYSTGNQKKG